MENYTEQELVKAFHMMWDNYPESVRLIDRKFRVVAGNPAYRNMGGQVDVKCNVGDPALHRGCQAIHCLKTRETKTLQTEVEGVKWDTYWIPVEGCEDYYVHFTNGLNALVMKKMAEAAAAAEGTPAPSEG